MTVVKPPRVAAFTLGHGERSWERPTSDTDKRSGVKTLRDMLVDQTYDVRTLSAADGLIQDVPKDVSVVMVIGPQKPFLPDELAALNRFLGRGGRLLLALDPENKVDMQEVLEPFSLTYMAEPLANDQVFARRTHQDSDRANIVTATFTSHPSVTTLQRLGGRAPVILPGAGWINTQRDRSAEIPVDAPIKAHHATFVDKNGNFQADPGEDRRAWELAATAVKKDARLFVLADSDALSDDAIKVAANELLALDIVHWLMGDETYSGVVSTEADVAISHTRKQDVLWFYSTIFLAPALVVAAGVAITKRSRRKPRGAGGSGSSSSGASPAGGAPPPAGRPATEGCHDRTRGSGSRRPGGAGPAGRQLHLAARARARARGGHDHRRDEVRSGRRSATRTTPARSTSPRTRGAARRRSGCTWSARRRPRIRKAAHEDAAAQAGRRRATWRAAKTRSSCSTRSRRWSRRARFGSLDAAKLKELGLEAPKRKLEVTVKGEVRRYEIGQPANATGGESFIRDTRDGRVYLMPRTMLTELQNGAPPGRSPAAHVRAAGVRSHRGVVGRQAEGAPAGRTRVADDGGVRVLQDPRQARSDGEELARRHLADVPVGHPRPRRGAVGRQARAGRARRLLRRQEGGGVARARQARAQVDSTTGISGDDTSPPPAQPEVYARTEHTAGWAKLHSASSPITDAQKLVAAP